MLQRALIVDGNHLIYRAHFKFKNLRTVDGKQTSILYGGPYILESLIRKLGPDKIMVVFDHSRSKFRTDLLPNYKERESKLGKDKESFYQQRDELIPLLNSFGIETYRVEGYEADDVIGYLVQQYYRKGWESVIVSADKDFVQLVGNNVLMYNVTKNVMVDSYNCKSHYGYTPRQCVDYLSLCGDDSDKIPGYPSIGPKRAEDFFKEHISIRKFLGSPKVSSKIDKKLLKEIYERNKKLIDIMYFVRKVLKPEDIKPLIENPKLDKVTLQNICAQNQIGSFLKIQFLKTFIIE